jgi:hypothetical protein
MSQLTRANKYQPTHLLSTGGSVSMDPGPSPTKLPSVQMNINLDTGKVQGSDIWQPKTTLRLGLLDTGASFNLISHRAHTALNRPMRPCEASVQSIAGDTEICGSIVIEWRFLPDDQRLVGSSKLYRAKFFILSQSQKPLFDCILGWPWLAENWIDVGKLLFANAVDLFQEVGVSNGQQMVMNFPNRFDLPSHISTSSESESETYNKRI